MRAWYTDIYGCQADLCQYATGTTRLIIRNPYGTIIHEKEYRSWRGAKIAMGKLSDGWKIDLPGKPLH